jgi:hypothetical protein
MKWLSLSSCLATAMVLSGCGRGANYVVIPDLKRAPEFVKESYLAFSGVPRIDLAGSYTWRPASVGPGKTPGMQREQSRFVIPIVPEGWDPSQPVPLWVSFSSNKKDQRPEMGALRAAMSAGQVKGQNVDYPERTSGVVRGKSAWQSAVEDAEKRFGLRSDPRAPIVSWRPRA